MAQGQPIGVVGMQPVQMLRALDAGASVVMPGGRGVQRQAARSQGWREREETLQQEVCRRGQRLVIPPRQAVPVCRASDEQTQAENRVQIAWVGCGVTNSR